MKSGLCERQHYTLPARCNVRRIKMIVLDEALLAALRLLSKALCNISYCLKKLKNHRKNHHDGSNRGLWRSGRKRDYEIPSTGPGKKGGQCGCLQLSWDVVESQPNLYGICWQKEWVGVRGHDRKAAGGSGRENLLLALAQEEDTSWKTGGEGQWFGQHLQPAN